MLKFSKLLNRYYNPDEVVYLTNLCQVYKYLNTSEEIAADLVDILYSGTRKDCLVFVFKKSQTIQELYKKWKNHELD
jgi:hypothetical protein